MKAGIITIGDELLLGQTINTNLARIGVALSESGINVLKSTTIRDEKTAITETLDDLLKKFDLVIITGGLGPTKDDVTKETLTHYFGTELILDEETLEHVRQIFESRNREMLPSNIHQAMLPKNAIILNNPLGTAPGMWFEHNGKVIVSLPGVPYELEGLLSNEVMPRLKANYNLNGKYYQTIMVQGIGESFLAEKIKVWEEQIYADDLHLAYLPSPGVIRLRLTTDNGVKDAEKIDKYFDELKLLLPQFIYGKNDESIFEVVGSLLKAKGANLGTVESCTGGTLASSFVLLPGASEFFKGGLITYSNALKVQIANVTEATLRQYGAVSEEVVREMALGGLKVLNVDYAIAVTGIAGPSGGTIEKPVGLVWIAVASKAGVVVRKYLFGENRSRNIEKATLSAANLLRLVILQKESLL